MDSELTEALMTSGAVLLEGPKACGKTQTALRAAASSVRFDLDPSASDRAALDPMLVLEGATPRLLDEWQRAPEVWDAVRRAVDDRSGPGLFILTGSAVPADDQTHHSGAMRILRLKMRPMSLFEAGFGRPGVSFTELAAGNDVRFADPGIALADVAVMVTRGGWPGNLEYDDSRALRRVQGYINEITRVDLAEAVGTRRDPQSVLRVMRSLARNVGTPTSTASITRDVNGTDGQVKEHTVANIIDGLSRLMVVEELSAWAPAIRSRTRLRAAAIRHFVDPSIATAAVGVNHERLLAEPQWFGFLFEEMVLRDVRVFSQPLGGRTYHYRDSSGLEADIVVEFPNGSWMAIEVKLGYSQIDSAAKNLLKLRERVDVASNGECLALVVMTSTGPAYTRRDGVKVVPAGLLGP